MYISIACTVPRCSGGVPSEPPDHTACTGARDQCDVNDDCVVVDTCPPSLAALNNGTIEAETTTLADDFTPSCTTGARADLGIALTIAQDSDVVVTATSISGDAIAIALMDSCTHELLCGAGTSTASVDVVNLGTGSYVLLVDANGAFSLSVATVPTTIAAGDLIFSEYLGNPALPLLDDDAEWVEIASTRARSISTSGVTLRQFATDADHPLTDPSTGSQIIVPPLGFVVGGRTTNRSLNGDVAVQFTFPFFIDNGAPVNDDLHLRKGAALLLDRLDLRTGFPLPTSGRSRELSRSQKSAAGNDASANWCLAAATGTPGADNACP